MDRDTIVKKRSKTKTAVKDLEGAPVEEPLGYNASSLVVNAQAYILADKYDIQSLKASAVTKYKEILLETWNSTSFIESARLVFNNTRENDRTLRDIIIQRASRNVKALFDRGEFVALLKSHNDFAVEVLMGVVLNPPQDDEEEEIDSWIYRAANAGYERVGARRR